MELTPVQRRSVPDDVFEQLLEGVVGGGLSPGDALMSERRMAEGLGVSRPAVREALGRIVALGLVEVRQGGTTVVKDLRRSAGFDLLPRLLVRGGEVDLDVARSILEARLWNGPKVAELAAVRGSDDLGSVLDGVVDVLAAATDGVQRQRVALEFWDLVVDAADSITFRLMFNTLRFSYEPMIEALAVMMSAEVDEIGRYRAVVSAIGDRDGERAFECAHQLLEPATTALTDVLTAASALGEER
ncbi:FadR family transcriptional regulator [Rhodococcus triatomae]|uniref:DNA-binding transcriptional regulator, FadR family n=1 Tax=Rhodococcus triatomae TaxID=300028 RepID=A0A1G8JMC3_9NOCA|nr:GntR family transcriptional regulator [Rhodococcus triatomae]QNG19686.1 FadR family transcriptional regulator [Rhodococcus triatomae]QNG24399.1 FadR family transcriptional regulator [Rhodococcus triatomae]SDI32221.1 DNA-binding transcriptional regulator, FadR family [Rhodococcus triatomae]